MNNISDIILCIIYAILITFVTGVATIILLSDIHQMKEWIREEKDQQNESPKPVEGDHILRNNTN